jgi:hypothetical protein
MNSPVFTENQKFVLISDAINTERMKLTNAYAGRCTLPQNWLHLLSRMDHLTGRHPVLAVLRHRRPGSRQQGSFLDLLVEIETKKMAETIHSVTIAAGRSSANVCKFGKNGSKAKKRSVRQGNLLRHGWQVCTLNSNLLTTLECASECVRIPEKTDAAGRSRNR